MTRPLALALVLLLTACLGPKPSVESASVERADTPGKATATVVVVNRGSGDGPTRVAVTIRDGTGAVIGRDERTVDLEPHERITLVLEVDIPEDAGDLRIDAKASYPPD